MRVELAVRGVRGVRVELAVRGVRDVRVELAVRGVRGELCAGGEGEVVLSSS